MPGVFDYSRYINVFATASQVKDIFPNDQYQIEVDFDQQGIDGWATTSSWTTIVVDRVRFDANKIPNFDNSTVIGYFEGGQRSQSGSQITVPANMYTGAILPASEINIPISVFQIDFSKDNEVFQKTFLFIQNWEPGVPVGDPTADPNYNPIAGLPSTLFFATYNEALFGEDYFVTAESNIPININGGQVKIWRQVQGNDIFLTTATFVGKKASALIPSYFDEGDPRNLVEGANILYATFNGRANYGPVVSNTATQLFDAGIPLVSTLSVSPNPTNTGTTVNIQATVAIDPTYTGPLSGVDINNTVTIRLINLNTSTYPAIQNQLITATMFLNNAVSGSIFITNDYIDQRLTNSSTYTLITATITTSSYFVEAFVERDYVIRVDWRPFLPGKYRGGSTSTVLTVNTTKTYSGSLEPIQKIRVSPIGYPSFQNSNQWYYYKSDNKDWQYANNDWTESNSGSDNYYFQPNDQYYLNQKRYILGFVENEQAGQLDNYFSHELVAEVNIPITDLFVGAVIPTGPNADTTYNYYQANYFGIQAQYTSTILKPLFDPIAPKQGSTVTAWPLGTTAISRYKLSMTDGAGINAGAQFSFVNTSTPTIYSTSNVVVYVETFSNQNQIYNWVYAEKSFLNSQQIDIQDQNYAGRNIYRWVRPTPIPAPGTPPSQTARQEYDWYHQATFTNTDLSVIQYDIQIERGEYPDRISFTSSATIADVQVGARFKLNPQEIKLSSTVTVRTSTFNGDYIVTRKQGNTIWMDPPWGYETLTNVDTNQQIPRAWWFSGEALLREAITFTNYSTENIFITQLLPVTQSQAQLNPYRLKVINAKGIFVGAKFYLGETAATRRLFTVDFIDYTNNYIFTLEEWYSYYASQLGNTARIISKNSYLTTSSKTTLSYTLTPSGENYFNIHNTDRDIVFTNSAVITTATLVGFANSTTVLVDILPNNVDANDEIVIDNKIFVIKDTNIFDNTVTLTSSWLGQLNIRNVVNTSVKFVQNNQRNFATATFTTIEMEPIYNSFIAKELRPVNVPQEYKFPKWSTTASTVNSLIRGQFENQGTYLLKYVSTITSVFFAANPEVIIGNSTETVHYNVIDGFDLYDSSLTYQDLGSTYLISFNVGQTPNYIPFNDPQQSNTYSSYRDLPQNVGNIIFYDQNIQLGQATLQNYGQTRKTEARIQVSKSSISTLSNITGYFGGNLQIKPRTLRFLGTFTSSLLMSDPENYFNRQEGLFKIKTDVIGMSKSPVLNPRASGSITYSLTNLVATPTVLNTQTVSQGVGDAEFNSSLITQYAITGGSVPLADQMIPVNILATYSGDSQRAASTSSYVTTIYPSGFVSNFVYPIRNDNRKFGLYTELTGFPAIASYTNLYIQLIIPKSTNNSVWNFGSYENKFVVTDGGYQGTPTILNEDTLLGTYSDRKTFRLSNPGLPTNPAFKITKIIIDLAYRFTNFNYPYEFTQGVPKLLPIVIRVWST